MNYIGKFLTNFKVFYNEINAATLTGAIDVVVVRQPDGSYLSSPFHVRFGKIGVLRSKEKVVDIEINGEPVDIHMRLGETGEAYFLHPIEEDEDELNKAEAKSQDSGIENEDPNLQSELTGSESAPQSESLTLRLKVDEETQRIIDEEDGHIGNDVGVVSRVPRQDSSKFVMKDIQTQTEQSKQSSPVEKDGSSADEVLSKSSPVSKTPTVKKSADNSKSESSENKPKSEIEDNSKSSKSQKRKKRKMRRNHQILQQQNASNASQNQLQVSTKGGRKKSQSGSQSSDASTTSEVADLASLNSSKEECVFSMEDVNKSSRSTSDLPQSSSMPVLRENAVLGSNMKSSQSDGAVVKAEKQWSREEPNTSVSNVHKELGPNFHPFSDTDISPPPSPNSTRPGTPIKSDTEFEVERERREVEEQDKSLETWNWDWGKLPTPSVKPRHKQPLQSSANMEEKEATASSDTPTASIMEEKDNLSTDKSGGEKAKEEVQATEAEEQERSMLGGMFSFMRATKKARHNPQAEGIYLEDLNPSDLSPEVAALYFPKYSGTKASGPVDIPAKEEDKDSANGPSIPHSPQSSDGLEGGVSLTRGGLSTLESDSEELHQSRHLVFDYKGYHDVAMSLCGQIPGDQSREVTESLFFQHLVTYDEFCADPGILNNPNLVVRLKGKFVNWKVAAPHIVSLVMYQRPLPPSVSEDILKGVTPRKSENSKRKPSRALSWLWGGGTDASTPTIPAENGESLPEMKEKKEEEDTVEVCAAETQTPTPPVSGNSSTQGDADQMQYKRTLRLTTKQIENLNLKDGLNEIQFSVTTAYQGTTKCKCRLFLWNHDEKIIVSDIDGTITKSDVLGQILPMIGNNWAQGGVAQLFTKIKNNGYNFLYLSARAIGQAPTTRSYLDSVVQEDMSLPEGPMLLNPASLFQAFAREVIERKSEEFKIQCLRDIAALFPSNPFYAGYGNRINDVWAYQAVGIPISRVFTINHKGELKHELTKAFQSSYSNLTDIVHHMFPVYSQEMLNHGEYSSVRYWSAPLPNYDDEISKIFA